MKPLWRSSSLDRRFACPGSATLEPLVDVREGEESWEGQVIHWMIADRAIRELGAVAPDGGLLPPKVPSNYRLPRNSEWLVDWGLRHIRETIPSNWSLMVEVENEIEFARWINRGHSDIIGMSPDATEARGIDWKTGREPVDPADSNWQIFSYELQAKDAWPSLQHIQFQIAQPRISEEDGFERVSTSVLKGELLERASLTLDAEACNALDRPMDLNSTKKGCRWCPLMFTLQCPALKQDRDMAKLTMTPEAVAAVRRQPNDEQLVEWVSVMRTLKPAAEAAEEALHARLDETECVVGGGMTVTRKIQRGSIEVLDPVALYRSAKEQLVTDERMGAAFKVRKSRLIDQLTEALNVPKTGAKGVTAAAIWDAHFAVHCRQGERRLLQFSE